MVGYNHLISNKREWNNCFTKNAHKISLNLPDLILLEQTGLDWMNENQNIVAMNTFKNSSGF